MRECTHMTWGKRTKVECGFSYDFTKFTEIIGWMSSCCTAKYFLCVFHATASTSCRRSKLNYKSQHTFIHSNGAFPCEWNVLFEAKTIERRAHTSFMGAAINKSANTNSSNELWHFRFACRLMCRVYTTSNWLMLTIYIHSFLLIARVLCLFSYRFIFMFKIRIAFAWFAHWAMEKCKNMDKRSVGTVFAKYTLHILNIASTYNDTTDHLKYILSLCLSVFFSSTHVSIAYTFFSIAEKLEESDSC